MVEKWYNTHEVKTMTLGENIKALRIKKGLTQKELASKLGIAINSVSRYETNERQPSFKMLENIASALETDISDLTKYQISRNSDIPPFEEMTQQEQKEFMINTIESIQNFFKDIKKPLEELQQVKQQFLLNNYNKLNTLGKDEAIKRVEELTEIPKYTTPDEEENPR